MTNISLLEFLSLFGFMLMAMGLCAMSLFPRKSESILSGILIVFGIVVISSIAFAGKGLGL